MPPKFKDRFLQADQDAWGDGEIGSAIFVDSVDKLYTEGHLIGNNTSTSSESAFIGKKAKGCHALLKRLAEKTGSPVNLQVYAILDERSLVDDTILVIEVGEDDEYFGVRMECSLAISRMFQSGETPPVYSNRTTMSMNYTDFVKMAGGESSGSASNDVGSSDDTETIYYLETSMPHLYDISVSGPYYPLDTIIPQVLRNFGEACLHGQLSIPTHTQQPQPLAQANISTPDARLRSFHGVHSRRTRHRFRTHHIAHQQQPQPDQNDPPRP